MKTQKDNKVCADTMIIPKKFFHTADTYGKFKQFSIVDQKIITDFGKPFNVGVTRIKKTPDDKYLYIGYKDGSLHQWSLEDNKIVFDFGKIHKEKISILEITKNGEYMIAVSFDHFGKFIQWRVKDNVFLKEYKKKKIKYNKEIVFTSDSKRMYISCSDYQKEIEMNEMKVIKNHGFITLNKVNIMKLTSDDKTQFIGCSYGQLYQFDTLKAMVVKNYGRYHMDNIKTMEITPDNEFQFTGCSEGYQKQLSIKDKTLFKMYGCVHQNLMINDMFISNNGEYQFTSGLDKHVRQFNIRKQSEIKDYGLVHKDKIKFIV